MIKRVISKNSAKVRASEERNIIATARKALMVANPDYFALSSCEQELFRVSKDEKANKKIKSIFLESLLSIPCNTETVDEMWESIEGSNLLMLNWAMLLTDGIGENFIYLNEGLADGVTLLKFDSLYDFDFDDYLFQEKSNKEDFSDYQGRDYYPFRFPSWIRLLINEEFHYGELTSVASHIKDSLDDFGSQYIDTLIPHDFVDGKDHGKQTKGGYLFNLEIDAAGLEGQLDELKDRWYSYIQEHCLLINEAQSEVKPAIYLQENAWNEDPNRTFIFNNEVALKQVRWRHFLADCQPLTADSSVIDELIQAETDSATIFLEHQYQDIMDNYDPNILKFRKKRTVVMTPGFLSDLDKLDQDE